MVVIVGYTPVTMSAEAVDALAASAVVPAKTAL
jgi:hypothetical protein